MNVRLLRRVAKHIVEEPRRYNQGSWCDRSNDAPCGTMACIAGWAVILGDKLDPKKIDHERIYHEAKRFHAAKTLRGRASVAVARIEHFIKTKGKE